MASLFFSQYEHSPSVVPFEDVPVQVLGPLHEDETHDAQLVWHAWYTALQDDAESAEEQSVGVAVTVLLT